MIFIQLFITFFEIGLFGFGGGYAMISLIQGMVVTRYHWLSMSEFTNVIAVSQMTPGPVGINSATYCGYTAVHNAGFSEPMAVLGSAIATLALMLPSVILMIVISKMFMKYMHTPAVQNIFKGIAAGCGGAARRCHAAAHERRELLNARQPMAVLDKHSALRCYVLRYDVLENKPYTHDCLFCHCRNIAVLLTFS